MDRTLTNRREPSGTASDALRPAGAEAAGADRPGASDSPLDEKLARMRACIRSHAPVAVAFSGGVDSTFVLKVAVDELSAQRVIAFTGISPSLAASERQAACDLAAAFGARHVLLPTQEFADSNYLANPANRCYYCKTELYSRIKAWLRAQRDETVPGRPHTLVNGTNLDDLGDHRPGLAAAAEHGVVSPCVEAGLTKPEIRVLSARLGLPTAEKPAMPCLSSRVQYGETITPEKLRMIERGEAILRGLGLTDCRVRHHDRLARIEVPAAWIERLASAAIRERIDAAFREIGYQYVALDLRGFRSGSLNEVIAFGKRQ